MKTIIKVILIIALVVLFGALPLNIIGAVFEWLANIIKTLAGWIDFFGWGGLLKGGTE